MVTRNLEKVAVTGCQKILFSDFSRGTENPRDISVRIKNNPARIPSVWFPKNLSEEAVQYECVLRNIQNVTVIVIFHLTNYVRTKVALSV
jgi:hypothetical protein